MYYEYIFLPLGSAGLPFIVYRNSLVVLTGHLCDAVRTVRFSFEFSKLANTLPYNLTDFEALKSPEVLLLAFRLALCCPEPVVKCGPPGHREFAKREGPGGD